VKTEDASILISLVSHISLGLGIVLLVFGFLTVIIDSNITVRVVLSSFSGSLLLMFSFFLDGDSKPYIINKLTGNNND